MQHTQPCFCALDLELTSLSDCWSRTLAILQMQPVFATNRHEQEAAAMAGAGTVMCVRVALCACVFGGKCCMCVCMHGGGAMAGLGHGSKESLLQTDLPEL